MRPACDEWVTFPAFSLYFSGLHRRKTLPGLRFGRLFAYSEKKHDRLREWLRRLKSRPAAKRRRKTVLYGAFFCATA
jgi:glutathione S-transferase